MNVPAKNNEKLSNVLDAVNANEELQTLWEAINVNAVTRMGMTDHGPVHFQIVANIALRIMRILHAEGIEMSAERDHEGFTYEDSEVIVFLASITHDLGMSIQRKGHEEMSLFLANRLLHELLADVYATKERTIIISETLHAIISHRSDGKPLTLEAGIVRVADALDMTEGRSRISFDAGLVDIHLVSHNAIKEIRIEQGETKPIHIVVEMNNSAGIFQIDGLFNEKIKGSGLEKYLSLSATNLGETEKKIIQDYEIE
ncbi:HD domain-containing protein [candidate division WWE3 bacterium]|uniref:HD domain-containing protein n=1 Tax=candidate division WWE3 bacterium TaxID=2053526 RepID=A0A955LKA5_UNCKA|nr:HD domain-containing protein [candidate division WWE3 bacterium]